MLRFLTSVVPFENHDFGFQIERENFNMKLNWVERNTNLLLLCF